MRSSLLLPFLPTLIDYFNETVYETYCQLVYFVQAMPFTVY